MERLLTLYSEVQSTDVRWLWYPFIAIGKITLLQGDPGDGKYSSFRRCWRQMVWQQEKTINLRGGMMLRKMQLSFRSKMVNKVLSRLKDVQLDITSIWSYNTSKWT